MSSVLKTSLGLLDYYDMAVAAIAADNEIKRQAGTYGYVDAIKETYFRIRAAEDHLEIARLAFYLYLMSSFAIHEVDPTNEAAIPAIQLIQAADAIRSGDFQALHILIEHSALGLAQTLNNLPPQS